jgi:bifunctional DNA-binding transcriptional regulator/antitoxin component of YhaV-PrlF toxin-antitoxin module
LPSLTVTAKGQITLKRDLLQHLNVVPGQKVEIDKLPDGRLIVAPATPAGSINDFIGSLAKKDGIKLSIEEIKEITERAWAGER